MGVKCKCKCFSWEGYHKVDFKSDLGESKKCVWSIGNQRVWSEKSLSNKKVYRDLEKSRAKIPKISPRSLKKCHPYIKSSLEIKKILTILIKGRRDLKIAVLILKKAPWSKTQPKSLKSGIMIKKKASSPKSPNLTFHHHTPLFNRKVEDFYFYINFSKSLKTSY